MDNVNVSSVTNVRFCSLAYVSQLASSLFSQQNSEESSYTFKVCELTRLLASVSLLAKCQQCSCLHQSRNLTQYTVVSLSSEAKLARWSIISGPTGLTTQCEGLPNTVLRFGDAALEIHIYLFMNQLVTLTSWQLAVLRVACYHPVRTNKVDVA